MSIAPHTHMPHSHVPRLVKWLSQLNAEGEIVTNRNALAMLAAVNGKSSVGELSRVHGAIRTQEGLTELLTIGAVCIDTPAPSYAQHDPSPYSLDDPSMTGRDRTITGSSTWAAVALGAVAIAVLVAGIVWALGRPAREGAISIYDRAPAAPASEAQHAHVATATTVGCGGEAGCTSTDVTPAITTETEPSSQALMTTESQQEASSAIAAPPAETIDAPPHTEPMTVPVRTEPTVVPVAQAPPATTAPTAVATVEPARATPSIVSAPRLLLDERFDDNRRAWPDNPSSTAWMSDSGYRLFAREPGRFVAIGAPEVGRLRSFTMTASFRKIGGPTGGGYGLIVGDGSDRERDGINQQGRFYVVEAGDRGEIGVWRRDEDRWTDLVPWTPSPLVRPGAEPNDLAVTVVRDELIFLVNGVGVVRVSVPGATDGRAGIFVGGDGNEVILRSLRIESVEHDGR